MRVYYDRDADLNLIKGKKVVIVGYAARAMPSLNLKDPASRTSPSRCARARPRPRRPKPPASGDGSRRGRQMADLMMMLTPDELQGDIYREHMHDNMKKGAALVFAHASTCTSTSWILARTSTC